jgi:hypothetical protein
MILKTYARLFTNDAEKTLETIQALHGDEPHLRLEFKDWHLIGIGDVFIVGGTDEALAPIRDSHGPLIVDDADATMTALQKLGAEITVPMFDAPTGRGFYARHADGIVVEYVEWKPELVERLIRGPLREGRGHRADVGSRKEVIRRVSAFRNAGGMRLMLLCRTLTILARTSMTAAQTKRRGNNPRLGRTSRTTRRPCRAFHASSSANGVMSSLGGRLPMRASNHSIHR